MYEFMTMKNIMKSYVRIEFIYYFMPLSYDYEIIYEIIL